MKPRSWLLSLVVSLAWACEPDAVGVHAWPGDGDALEPDAASLTADMVGDDHGLTGPDLDGAPACTLEPWWYPPHSCPVPDPFFPGLEPSDFALLPAATGVDPLEVHPAAGVDAWELRTCFANFACVTALTFGRPCSGARDAVACHRAFEALAPGHGFAAGCEPLSCYAYLAGTRGDQAFAVADVADLVDFLAPFDTVADAALLLFASNYQALTGSVTSAGVRPVADGWQVLVVHEGQPCDPATADRYLLHVATTGALTPICRQLYRAECVACR